MAPELFVPQPYTKAVDVWSLGVLTYASLVGYQPFDGETEAEVKKKNDNNSTRFFFFLLSFYFFFFFFFFSSSFSSSSSSSSSLSFLLPPIYV
jgi:serine/threonine protein kinase